MVGDTPGDVVVPVSGHDRRARVEYLVSSPFPLTQTHAGNDLALERILFFSDAVFAIAITLLVIEIKVPELHQATDAELGRALVQLLPRIIGFIVSFFLIGQTWAEHHLIGRQLRGFDRGLVWKNLWLLFFVAAMPFVSALFSEYFNSRLAVTIYALMFTGLGLAKAGLWRYVVRKDLVDPASPDVVSIGRRIWAPPIGAAIVALAGGMGVPYAVMGFVLIPIVARFLNRRAIPAPGH